jgi:BirA family transcriptional regulator, biotin operon repressor / biotin---[acetyl-CoA-carboxylase] ligase
LLHKAFTNPFADSFVELSTTDSTNNYALNAIRLDEAVHGAAFFTWEQTAGKGQMGRKWQSEKGANIALSVVLQPGSIPVTGQFQLSACVAVAAQQCLSQYAGDDTCIKWPNDLYWGNRKLGGILIESIIGGAAPGSSQSWKWAVAGIGININQSVFSPDLPNPVSLKQITGTSYSAIDLAKELHACLMNSFTKLTSEGFGPIFSEYNSKLYKRNEIVKLKKDARVFQTTIKGVSADGNLITENNGIEEMFAFGEVSWII